jgi:uncharacterized membrane protein
MDVITAITWQVVRPVMVVAVILLLMGIGMLIGAVFVNRERASEV